MDERNRQESIINIKNLYKEFDIDDSQVEVLKNINLEIYPGEFVIIFGHSGCGKSTLLNTITGLERPTRGSIKVCGNDIYKLNEDGRAKFRQNNLGLVLQQANWIKSLNVIENVAYPLQISGGSQDDANLAASKMIEHMNMSKYKKHMPSKLSGGQQQRISMCRALVPSPQIIIADEPTGNLDTASGNEVMEILKKINEESGKTILMVSHNQEYERYASKIIKMKDGAIENIISKKALNGSGRIYKKNPNELKPGHLKFRYILKLAIKSLLSHKMRTALTSSGVAVSVGFIMFLLSFGMGLQKISVEQIANIDAMQILDVSVTKSNILRIDDSKINKLKTIGNVENVQAQISSASKIKYNKSEIEGVVYGESTEYLKMNDVKLSSGRIYNDNRSDEVIISEAAQKQLSNKNLIGEEITFDIVVLPNLLTKEQSTKRFTKKLKVVGISDNNDIVIAYMPLSIFTKNNIIYYSNLKVRMNSKEAVPQAKAEIENLGFKVESIKETIDQINKFFGIFQIILAFGGSIAIIVACIGMFNTLTITLVEKTKEVGFMKILGTVKRDIYWLFTLESVIIGLLGSTLGVIISCSASKIINHIIVSLADGTGNKPVELFYIPFYVPIAILLTSFIISALTSYYPARRATRIKPLDAMRYE